MSGISEGLLWKMCEEETRFKLKVGLHRLQAQFEFFVQITLLGAAVDQRGQTVDTISSLRNCEVL